MSRIGRELLRIMMAAKQEVLIVSPFIKVSAMAKVLHSLRLDVPVRCFTRWRPEDVAAGVSDLEVADLLGRRGNSQLFLVSDLHAKVYCSEHSCLITSANLSDSALGWRSPVNLELYLTVKRDHPAVRRLEADLVLGAVPLSPTIFNTVKEAACGLEKLPVEPQRPEGDIDAAGGPLSLGTWTPTCLVPSKLFELYQGHSQGVSREAALDGYRDLEVLRFPLGLEERRFRGFVRSRLCQHPAISRLISRARQGRVFIDSMEGHFEGLAAPYLADAKEASRLAGLWVAHFFGKEIEYRKEGARPFLASKGSQSATRE